ncbi:CsbD family protein [Agrobacterium rosae]|uniref:CsbD family protein n=1 Tax=Agrobacterium rosae TaxID=1972867 RepID=A0AAW9FR74_9HYPH|nr:CsbD family protein [Agrobacterium rosae]MDX8305666.1 CsbD family protein [Agrobacterium rosae]
MGSTKAKRKANEVAGEIRQALGNTNDNQEMQGRGVAHEAKGHAQQAKGEA